MRARWICKLACWTIKKAILLQSDQIVIVRPLGNMLQPVFEGRFSRVSYQRLDDKRVRFFVEAIGPGQGNLLQIDRRVVDFQDLEWDKWRKAWRATQP